MFAKAAFLSMLLALVSAGAASAHSEASIAPLQTSIVSSAEEGNRGDLVVELTLNPASLADAALTEGALGLPTFEGEVLLTGLMRNGGMRENIEIGDDGIPVSRIGLSNVWTSNVNGVRATLMLNPTQFSAIIETSAGITVIEPAVLEGEDIPAGTTSYVMIRPGQTLPPEGAVDGFDGHSDESEESSTREREGAGEDDCSTCGTGTVGGSGNSATLPQVSSVAAPTVTKSVYIYPDQAFLNHWGSSAYWDKAEFFLTETNTKFAEVGLQYSYCGGTYSSGYWQSNNIDTAYNELRDDHSNSGCNARLHLSYRDFDGCTIGLAPQPGDFAVLQVRDDNCHASSTPDSDFERVYLLKHELGHTNNARHESSWSNWDGCCHRHRSIMLKSAWYHYHDVWSQANADRMRSHLGTTGASLVGAGTLFSDQL